MTLTSISILDSTEHDHFKCLCVLPGSVYKYNTNRLVGLSRDIPSLGQYSALATSSTKIDFGLEFPSRGSLSPMSIRLQKWPFFLSFKLYPMRIWLIFQKWSDPMYFLYFQLYLLIFWVSQGLAGGTRRISDLDPLVMRFRQKNIMQTDLQG